MASKKIIGTAISEIKKLIGSKKMIIGTRQTLKNIKRGDIKKVFVSANCPDHLKQDLTYYGKLGSIEVVELEQANDELGSICKKGFSISVIGVLK